MEFLWGGTEWERGEGEKRDWPLDSGAAEQKREAERHWAGGDTEPDREAGKQRQR